MTNTAAILQEEVKTGRRPQLRDRRQVKGEHLRLLDAEQIAHGTTDNGIGAAIRALALAPVLELDKGHTRVLATTGEAEAGYGQYGVNVILLVFQEVVAHIRQHHLGALLGRPHRQLHHGHDDPLILFRQEGGGHPHKEHCQHRQHGAVDQAVAHALLDHLTYTALIAVGTRIKGAVEPAKEAALGTKLAMFHRLEQGGTERRSQDQRHQHRQHHGRDDGQRELAIDGTGRAAEERHRHEHGGEHQGDPHQRAGDLGHRLAGRFQRGEILLAHQSLHVLHHHDGVIHQQADGQHHTEHGEGVDGEAERRHHPEGTEQHHRHRDGRDQGGAEVLQEQIHDAEHQENRLDQGLHHLLDGDLHKRRGVVGVDDLHIGREVIRQLIELGTHLLGGIQRVGAGSQLNGDRGGGLAVVERIGVIAFACQLNPGHIFQPYLGAILIHPQQDVVELLHGRETGLPHDGGGELLIFHRRGATQLAERYLGVLRLDGRLHIPRGHLHPVELVGIEPHPHGVLAAEQGDIPYPVQTAQGLLDVGDHIVRQIVVVHRAIAGDEGRDHQEAAGGLLYPDPLLLNLLWQQRHRLLQLVLHLHLGDIGIGPRLEGEGHRHPPRGVRLGGHVEQVIQPGHVLFDDLGHRVFHRFSGCTRIAGRNTDSGRRNARILGDRQFDDGQAARQHDHQRDHPSKNGSVYKKSSHEATTPSYLLAGVLDAA